MWSVVARKRRKMKRRREKGEAFADVTAVHPSWWPPPYSSQIVHNLFVCWFMQNIFLDSQPSNLSGLHTLAQTWLGQLGTRKRQTPQEMLGLGELGALVETNQQPGNWVFIMHSWLRRQAGESRYRVFVGQQSQAAVPREEETGTFCIQQASLLIRGKSCHSHVSETLWSLTWHASPYIISPGWFLSTMNSTGLMM